MSLVVAEDLVKRYGDVVAVDGIDFSIVPGECFGLLGPNGAGKTTTVKMIHAAVPITSGRLLVFGLDITGSPREIKAQLGVCPQDVNLDQDFTVLKNLIVFARYFGIPRAEARRRAERLIEQFHLSEKRDRKIEGLSGGMKKRLLVVRALINEPRLLILDEPTAGLDPQARHQIWEKVRELRRAGKTVVLTTHYMDEAAALCDRLVIIDRGRVIEQGAPSALVARHIGREVIELDEAPPVLLDLLRARGVAHETYGAVTHVYADDGRALLDVIAKTTASQRFLLRNASLEDVFLKLTGRQLRE